MLVELSSCLRCVSFNISGLPPSHSESESKFDDAWIVDAPKSHLAGACVWVFLLFWLFCFTYYSVLFFYDFIQNDFKPDLPSYQRISLRTQLIPRNSRKLYVKQVFFVLLLVFSFRISIVKERWLMDSSHHPELRLSY